MKPEPLKNKRHISPYNYWFKEENIKSAVEYLRQKNCYCQDYAKENEGKCDVCKDIEEAFPDLYSKSE